MPILAVEHLSKRYHLGQIGSGTFSRDLEAWWAKMRGKPSPFQKIGGPLSPRLEEETLWALRDVSFSVEQGEALGIIGPNGAGKSTLLKILSRVTAPTSGKVKIRGRIASLLEVGTGFHPELTGRENIFLNGAILGMQRQEIQRKFDEIVAFAGIEAFIDTPVKRYSSGMYVRLAFAVAAHLEPEILVVDEVLAVGDADFQKKCLGKMGEVAQGGRTVLFVSHNMVAVQNLCQRGLLLQKGQITQQGEIGAVIRGYLRFQEENAAQQDLSARRDRKGNGFLRFTRVEMIGPDGQPTQSLISGQDARLRFYYTCPKPPPREAQVCVSFVVRDQEYPLINLNSVDRGQENLPLFTQGYFECHWPHLNLTARAYHCSLFCSINNDICDWLDTAFVLNVEDGDFYGSGKKIGFQSKFLAEHHWQGRESEA